MYNKVFCSYAESECYMDSLSEAISNRLSVPKGVYVTARVWDTPGSENSINYLLIVEDDDLETARALAGTFNENYGYTRITQKVGESKKQVEEELDNLWDRIVKQLSRKIAYSTF